MTDTDRRQRVISSAPHLSPDDIAARTFGTKVRGYAEAEVRTFLKRVAEELAAARGREHELEAAVDALEEQVRAPRPLSEQELLDALGEETARLLRSAREASDDIRRKAEERAAQVLADAQAAGERIRSEADVVLTSRREQGEASFAELVAAGEARASELRETAAHEAEHLLEAARVQGKVMLDEAKSARERVLGDLVRRRALLAAQIEELRGGRDRLLDAYRTVKRTFLEATEALGQVEARAAAERSAPAEPIDVAAEIDAEIEALNHAADADAGEIDPGEHDGAPTEAVAIVDLVAADADSTDSDSTDDSEESAARLADVDSLFARLRAGHGTDDIGPGDTGEGDVVERATIGVATATIAPPAADDGAGVVPAAQESTTVAGEEPVAVETPARLSSTEWRARRATTVDPLLGGLVKRAKRTAQDDQNALLDAVRRHKGRPSAEQVLPDHDKMLREWGAVVGEAVTDAYRAGADAAGGSGVLAPDAGAPEALVREAAEAVVAPLRERLVAAIDSGHAGDTGGLVERIGARYREWKNQSLERGLGEVLAFAWARGVYDAVPDGAVIWWVPFEEGRCSDCDDNALEPTVKGKEFPTGQMFPPAHPGCKCLLAPGDLLTAPTAG